MSSELICTFITAGGVVLSAVISYFTSRYVANNEIKKLKMTWDREDAKSSSKDIAELTKLVCDFTACENDLFRIPAMSKTAEMRSAVSGEFAKTLDDLYTALSHCDRFKSQILLSEVIKQQSKAQGDTQDKKGNRPKGK